MRFDTIYIEDEIRNHQSTQRILERLKYGNKVYCNKYTEIFNPKNQNFRVQKKKPALILAKKKKNFIIKTPEKFSIGFKENYYFSHMMNCIYDCKYCFLQGMFNSANYLVFVNLDDFLKEIKKKLYQKKHNICFFSGYDCDSLALEKITNFLNVFLRNFKIIKNGFLEIRTKSGNIDVLKVNKPLNNVIVAYSLNPQKIIENFEQKTPSLHKRLKNIEILQNLGWKIGIRFDPLIRFQQNKKIYQLFFKKTFKKINPKLIHSITVGNFRMPDKFMTRLTKIRPEDSLLFNQMKKENTVYNKMIRDQCKEELVKFVDESKIFFN